MLFFHLHPLSRDSPDRMLRTGFKFAPLGVAELRGPDERVENQVKRELGEDVAIVVLELLQKFRQLGRTECDSLFLLRRGERAFEVDGRIVIGRYL